MDFKESEIDNESRVMLEVDLPKNNDPIITFSPDRSRFDPGGQNHKSRNASIASDFDLNLEVSYSKADIKVNQFQNQPPNSVTPSVTDLLSSGEHLQQPPQGPLLGQFNSSSGTISSGTNSSEGGGVDNIINLDLKHQLSLGLVPHQTQTQSRVSNGSIVSANGGSGQSMSTPVTAPVAQPTKGASLSSSRKMSSSLNGTMSGNEEIPNPDIRPGTENSTVQLQKKLEKKIAQASAIAAAMNSMSPNSPTEFPLASPKDETEFGEWNTHYEKPVSSKNYSKSNSSNSNPPSKSKSPQHDIQTSSKSPTTDPNLSNTTNKSSSKLKSSTKSKQVTSHKSNRYSSSAMDDRKPDCVKFQENEVEIICKSSRTRMAGGGSLLPPERLAVPHKSLLSNNSNAGSDNRKHSSSGGTKSGTRSKEDNNSTGLGGVDGGGTVGLHSNTGSTSEVKPLVEWDSDESEEELSFFPAGKPKAKLTDNLSIDNLSLSGEEDDLHLSPPRAMAQKCPCDPRQWISDHVAKLPKSNSFTGGQSEQCIVS